MLVYLRMQNTLSKFVEYHKSKKDFEDSSVVLRSDSRDYGLGAQILRALGISESQVVKV